MREVPLLSWLKLRKKNLFQQSRYGLGAFLFFLILFQQSWAGFLEEMDQLQGNVCSFSQIIFSVEEEGPELISKESHFICVCEKDIQNFLNILEEKQSSPRQTLKKVSMFVRLEPGYLIFDYDLIRYTRLRVREIIGSSFFFSSLSPSWKGKEPLAIDLAVLDFSRIFKAHL